MGKLKTLCSDVTELVEGQRPRLEPDTLDEVVGDVLQKVETLLKQRENLQRAVNHLQSEKQAMMTTIKSQAQQQAQLTASLTKSQVSIMPAGTIVHRHNSISVKESG